MSHFKKPVVKEKPLVYAKPQWSEQTEEWSEQTPEQTVLKEKPVHEGQHSEEWSEPTRLAGEPMDDATKIKLLGGVIAVCAFFVVVTIAQMPSVPPESPEQRAERLNALEKERTMRMVDELARKNPREFDRAFGR